MPTPRFLKRVGALTVLLAVSGAATLLTGGVANAQTVTGPMSITPTSGSDLTAASASTSAPCPATSNALHIRLTGPNNMNFLITTRTTAGFSTTSPMVGIPFGQTFKDAAAQNTPSTTLVAGTYTATLNCVSGTLGGTIEGSFAASIVFSSPTAWTFSAPATATTTTLAATPASPATQGTVQTLTATVSPAAATGSVQFFNGTTAIGAAVPVASGTASTTTTLPVGTNSLTAVFTGGAGYGNSTSAAVSYVVNAAPATSTALSVNPSGTVNQGTPVALTATVSSTSGSPTGSVQFNDGATAVTGPITVTGGTATFTIPATPGLAQGTHNFVAVFTSNPAGAFAGSTSLTVSIVVVAQGTSSTTETIQTEVVGGALVISVPGANPTVVLPTPTLLADASKLTTSGPINTVRVVDTRAGNPGWTASGQVGTFSSASGTINAANLGWTPQVVLAQTPAQVVTAGPVVNPANAIAPGATAPAGLGLASPRTLATAAAGFGTGTADLGAQLALNVPTSTTAGVYTATLTLTAI